MAAKQNNIVLKLTYLWAFAEVALGGLLHMFHIPVTGFVVGGFAIIIIVLIAKFSLYSIPDMLKALSLVLLVKFLLSPHTPYGAYIAVSFQGLLAAILVVTTKGNKWTVFIFSVVVMIESAIQKPLIAWLIMGNDFFKAAALFIQKTFGLSTQIVMNTIIFIFIIYLAVYAIWGIVVGHWANKLSASIHKMEIDKQLITALKNENRQQSNSVKKSFGITTFIVFIIFLTGTALLVYTGFLPLNYLLRFLLVMILLFIVIPYFLKLYKKRISAQQGNKVTAFLTAMPAIQHKTQIAYLLSRPINSLQKVRNFIGAAIWLNVFYNDDENE